MHYLTLINRTSKPLNGTWNGRNHVINPGKNSFPEVMANKFKDQNPVMGSQDPYSLERDSLLGIEEYNDPIDPIEQSTKAELLDRAKMDTIAKTAEVLLTSVARLYPAEKASALPTENAFVSPKV